MQYEEALKVWGAAKIAWAKGLKTPVDPATVIVTTDFDHGFACCGGRDPDCYCSYAESPSARVVVTSDDGRYEMDVEDFDFAQFLKEVIEAAEGSLSL